jgi:hypothetical protein
LAGQPIAIDFGSALDGGLIDQIIEAFSGYAVGFAAADDIGAKHLEVVNTIEGELNVDIALALDAALLVHSHRTVTVV